MGLARCHCELLFLMRRPNALPMIYWNRPTWWYFRESDRETYREAAARMVGSVDPDVVLYPVARTRRVFAPALQEYVYEWVDFAEFLTGYRVEEFASDTGNYEISPAIR